MPNDLGRKPERRYPKFEPLAETLERVLKNIKSRNGEPRFKSGLAFLDKGLLGFEQTHLLTLAARPGVGKTALACQLALAWAKSGHKVAFISLEMAKETLLERMFCIDRELDAFRLRTVPDKIIEAAYSKFCGSIGLLPLRIIDDFCHTEEELYTLIEYLEFRPDVIFLDHIQEIRAGAKTRNWGQWEILTEYLRYLKQIAMQYKIAIVALSQINRQGEEKPTLANLKGCGGIEEMSDAVLLMHQLKEPTTDGANFKIAVAKNRNGVGGVCYDLYFKADCLKFYDSKYYAEIAA